MHQSRYLKFRTIALVLIFIALLKVGSDLYISSDEAAEEVISWVEDNEYLHSRFGEITDARIARVMNFQGDAETPPFSRYRVTISGDFGSGTVVIKMINSTDGARTFEIDSEFD